MAPTLAKSTRCPPRGAYAPLGRPGGGIAMPQAPISGCTGRLPGEGPGGPGIRARPSIAVCAGAACGGLDSAAVAAAFSAEIKQQAADAKLDFRVTGCHGFLQQGTERHRRAGDICYFEVKPEDAAEIVACTLKGEVVERLVYHHPVTGEKAVHMSEVPFYKHQMRILIGDIPKMDPMRIDDYLAVGGYAALAKALSKMSPDQVLD